MANSVFIYGDDITWSLPVAFQYEVVWGTIFNHFKDHEIDLPQINGFGCPNCMWAGGRVSHIRHQLDREALRRMFEYFDRIKLTPSYTFSCTQLTYEQIQDPYANYLLDMSLEFGAHFIVYDDRLKDHIRRKNSNAYIVASVVKPAIKFQGPTKEMKPTPEIEAEFYNELLKEYDLVVVRPEFSEKTLLKHPEVIDDISRIEVLINQPCIHECPKMPEHYRTLENFRIEDKRNPNPNPGEPFHCIRGTLTPVQGLNNTLCHSEATVKKLVKHGVKHLKLQGRSNGASPTALLMQLYTQMFRSDGPNFLHASILSQGSIEREQHYYNEHVLQMRPNFGGPMANNVYRKMR